MITDHLGTVHAVVDENRDIVESYRYDAWGRVLGVYDSDGPPLAESAIGNRYLFQGREYSWRTGLYYFRARWYDPVTGRFLSKDPIGIAGGLNQYVACENNPVSYTDPYGLIFMGKFAKWARSARGLFIRNAVSAAAPVEAPLIGPVSGTEGFNILDPMSVKGKPLPKGWGGKGKVIGGGAVGLAIYFALQPSALADAEEPPELRAAPRWDDLVVYTERGWEVRTDVRLPEGFREAFERYGIDTDRNQVPNPDKKP